MLLARMRGALLGACGLLALAAPAAAADRIATIAFQGALTGPIAFIGVPIGNAVTLAIEQAKDELARAGVELRYLPADDQVDPAQAPAVARKVIQDPAVLGVVGPIFGNTVNAAGPLYTEARLAMMTIGTAAALTTKGWTVFRIVPNDDLQSVAVAGYLVRKLKLTRIAILDDGTQYGHGLAAKAEAEVARLGGTVVTAETIDPASDDYSSTIAKLMAAGAEAVFLGAVVDTEAVFNRQLAEAGFKGAFFAPDGSLSPDYVKLTGAGAEGTYFTCQCAPVPAYGGPATGPLARFVAAYEKRFGSPPQAYTAEGYDAAGMMIEAIRSGVRDREGMLAFLRSRTFEGVTRTYRFRADGEPEGTTINIYQVRGGRIAWLGTTDELVR